MAGIPRGHGCRAWEDGRSTAGAQSAEGQEERAIAARRRDVAAIGRAGRQGARRKPVFISAAFPLNFPAAVQPLRAGQHFGAHVDNAIRGDHLTGRIRTDLSVTLFCLSPTNTTAANWSSRTITAHEIKLPAGHLVLYPRPACTRYAGHPRRARRSFFWLQSMIRQAMRAADLRLDTAIQGLVARLGHNDPEVVKLTGSITISSATGLNYEGNLSASQVSMGAGRRDGRADDFVAKGAPAACATARSAPAPVGSDCPCNLRPQRLPRRKPRLPQATSVPAEESSNGRKHSKASRGRRQICANCRRGRCLCPPIFWSKP